VEKVFHFVRKALHNGALAHPQIRRNANERVKPEWQRNCNSMSRLQVLRRHCHQENTSMKLLHLLSITTSAAILGAFALTASVPAHADTIAWTNWYSGTAGTPGSASGYINFGPAVTYSGEIISLQHNYPSWTPPTSYIGGAVDNAPPQSGGIIQMQGGTALEESITFSSSVINPVIAIWSLGQPGDTASFDFTPSEPFTVVAGGPSNEYGGESIYQGTGPDIGNVYGAEGNGVIQFTGTYKTIDFTTPAYEYWYGFTVGEDATLTPPVPEPETLSLLGLGLAALPFLRSRFARRRRA
jgi:hypothetical protein